LRRIHTGIGAERHIVRVNPSGTGDAPTIQAAIAAASPGDTILLAPGTYAWAADQAASPQSMISMRPGLTLLGEAGPGLTVLDALGMTRVIECANTGPVRIESVTLTHGRASVGGGLLADAGSIPTLDHCVVYDNHVDGGRGAGVSAARATLRDCLVDSKRS
jgi:hypothetical protein